MQHNMLIEFFQWAFTEHIYVTMFVLILWAPTSYMRVRLLKD